MPTPQNLEINGISRERGGFTDDLPVLSCQIGWPFVPLAWCKSILVGQDHGFITLYIHNHMFIKHRTPETALYAQQRENLYSNKTFLRFDTPLIFI